MLEQNSGDLFGCLPDEILCRIISFLPSETALETILISKRWRGLWNLASIQQSTVDGIATEVSKFLTQFDILDPLRRPRRLQLHFGRGSVLLATIAANNKLKVEFSTGDEEFPRHFSWQLRLHHQNGVHHLCPSTFFVKTLHLKSVGFHTYYRASSIVSRFQCLESLKIIECSGLQSLHVESSPKLVSLTILDCPHLESLDLIKSSKLRSFHFRGKLPRIWPENHFNLADAMLDFRQGPCANTWFAASDFDPALLTIKNAKVVTLCRWTFETLIWPSIFPLKGAFQFYKLKELWWIDYSEAKYNADALISFLKLCPALKKLFVTIDPKSYRGPSSSSYSEKDTRHTELSHLKVVKLEGFLNKEDEITVLKHIRELVTVEPLIVAASNKNCGNLLRSVPSPKHAQMYL